MRKTLLLGLVLAAATALPATLAQAAPANYSWSGETASALGLAAAHWSQASNWKGGTAPSAGAAGTLEFPLLSGEGGCSTFPIDTCGHSENDISGIQAEKLLLIDAGGYFIGGDAIELGAGGLEDVNDADQMVGASLDLPLELSAEQTWSLDGSMLSVGGALSGTSNLDVSLEERGWLNVQRTSTGVKATTVPDDEVGTVTVKGTEASGAGPTAGANGTLELALPFYPGDAPAKLNATDGNPITVEHAKIGGDAILGPLTVTGGELEAGGIDVTGAPFGSIAVQGAATLDSNSAAAFWIREGTPEAGDDYSQLSATGTVDLGGARVSIGVRNENDYSACPALIEGDEYTLVTTTGKLEGVFSDTYGRPIANEGLFTVDCPSGTITLQIDYTAHEVTATVVAPPPVNEAAPAISGEAVEGQTLSAVAGSWEGSPTTIAYQWLRCDSAGGGCAAIAGAEGPGYTLTSEDVGHTIELRETASNGTTPASATSSPTDVVAEKPAPPINGGGGTVSTPPPSTIPAPPVTSTTPAGPVVKPKPPVKHSKHKKKRKHRKHGKPHAHSKHGAVGHGKSKTKKKGGRH
ncbi:MAG TPA: hypothetical protein VFW38_07055 [Solirubrobacteraceae bacterium]|nr:hypothetical protein [Solirubrobacteraceae bacterium]